MKRKGYTSIIAQEIKSNGERVMKEIEVTVFHEVDNLPSVKMKAPAKNHVTFINLSIDKTFMTNIEFI